MKSFTFYGLELVTCAGLVMTPRPASEKLVSAAIALVGDQPPRVVDVGTGSGAIAIAIAAAVPRAEVFATDTSAAAVALARLNVGRVGLSSRVKVLRGNLLDPISGYVDLIVANLPYLPIRQAARRPELANEPPQAVFAAGDGLGPYRRLIAASRRRMSEEGTLIIQFHGDVLTATRETLDILSSTLSERARAANDQFPLAA
jgi:release factor glutamine methyltransferase